jgi:hypothetical protein
MKLTSKSLAGLLIVLMFGGIFFSNILGWWETESTKEAAVYTEGEFAGQANPADIRGSYTFGDVENNFDVPAEVLAQAFGVETSDPAAFAVKSLEEMYLESPQEVGTASVRLFTAFYLGLPYDLAIEIYLPESAAEILRTRALSPEQAAYLELHTVPDLGAEAAQPALSPAAPEATVTPEHSPVVAEGTIKGKTTFAELLEWGLDAAVIEQVLGMPMPAAPGVTVRDFCSQNGLAFETVKPAMQAELDKLK